MSSFSACACASAFACPEDSTAAATACSSSSVRLASSTSFSFISFCLSSSPLAFCSVLLASCWAARSMDLSNNDDKCLCYVKCSNHLTVNTIAMNLYNVMMSESILEYCTGKTQRGIRDSRQCSKHLYIEHSMCQLFTVDVLGSKTRLTCYTDAQTTTSIRCTPATIVAWLE